MFVPKLDYENSVCNARFYPDQCFDLIGEPCLSTKMSYVRMFPDGCSGQCDMVNYYDQCNKALGSLHPLSTSSHRRMLQQE